jgi:hypothetical protein
LIDRLIDRSSIIDRLLVGVNFAAIVAQEIVDFDQLPRPHLSATIDRSIASSDA